MKVFLARFEAGLIGPYEVLMLIFLLHRQTFGRCIRTLPLRRLVVVMQAEDQTTSDRQVHDRCPGN